MSEYAWTYVKESHLTKRMKEAECDRLIGSISGRFYMTVDYQTYHDRMMKILGGKDMDKAFLDKHLSLNEYNRLRAQANKDIEVVKKILKGEASFKDLSKEERDKALLRVYNKELYVHVEGFECFRLRKCIEGKKYTTVDQLLELLSKPENDGFIYYWDPYSKNELVPVKEGYTDELKHIIRKHYGKFGDGNFFVAFG